ncbi:MAG TPA: PqqD family protein [Gemmatimonadales bacterium]|nr:PqqD family protein [Gemmatimonadales bacterium]
MTSPDATDRPRARSDVLFRQLDDEWVVYDPKRDRVHALNLSAAMVWSLCTGERGAAEIAEAVGESFTPPQPAAHILADVEASIARFRAEGLLE